MIARHRLDGMIVNVALTLLYFIFVRLGRGDFTGTLLGSTDRTLVHHVPCPLVVVRPQG